MRPKPGMNAGKNGVLVGAYNKHYRKAIVSEVRTPPQDGDMRIFMGMDPSGSQERGTDPLEFGIQEYNGENWETRGNMAQRSGSNVVDMFLSGFLQAGESVLSSPGLTWDKIATSSFGASSIYGVTYGNNKYIAVGAGGKIAYSSDANTWTQAATPSFGASEIRGVTYGNGKYIAVGNSGKIAYSTDGDSWTQAGTPSFGASNIYGVTYGNSKYVAVGDDGKIAYSTDGNTWTQAGTPSFTGTIYGVVYGDGKYVAVEGGGEIGYSTDGDTWTQATTPSFGATAIYGIAYGNDKYVAVGASGKIGYSADGDAWTQVVSSPFGAAFIYGVAHGGNVFIAVGGDGKISRSSDGGKTWGAQVYGDASVSQPFGTDGFFMGVCYSDDDKRFILVGYLNSDNSGIIATSDYLEAGAGIVEQGTNSNGEYVIFSNGLQVCWNYRTNLSAISSSSNLLGSTSGTSYFTDNSLTFPAAFKPGTFPGIGSGTNARVTWNRNITATTFSLSCVSNSSSSGNLSGGYVAIGWAS